MKDPAVIDESTSTSPSDRDPDEDSPVDDDVVDAATLHREADAAADESPAPAEDEAGEAAGDARSPDQIEAPAETSATDVNMEQPTIEGPAFEEPVPEVETPVEEAEVEVAEVEEAAVEEPTSEIAAAVEEPASEIAAFDEPVPEVAQVVEESTPEVAAADEPTPEVAPAVAETPPADDPFGGPGDWYVVHTYAGYENKVKTNLESRIHTMQMEDKIFRVHIPMEDVMEIKSGKKQVVQKKIFPGYLLVKMWYDNDSWYVVRNTPGVTGFVSAGTGSKPTPLSKREIDKILIVKKEEVKPQFRLGFEEGDVVRIISGPFADFNGTINEINVDQSKLKVLVNIFDRETPVELGFDQVSKV